MIFIRTFLSTWSRHQRQVKSYIIHTVSTRRFMTSDADPNHSKQIRIQYLKQSVPDPDLDRDNTNPDPDLTK